MHTPTGLIHLEYASDSDVGGHVYGFTGNSAMFESKTFIFMFFFFFSIFLHCLLSNGMKMFCQNWDYICVNGRWRCDIDLLKCNIGYRQVSVNWSDNQWDKIINWTHLTLAIHYCRRKTMSICAVWDWQNPNIHTKRSEK